MAEQNKAKSKSRELLWISWPLLRKIETLVFACMIVAIPFFAIKVVTITTTSLNVKKTAADLVKDLIRVKQLAKDHGIAISVVTRPPTQIEAAAYLIQDDQRTIEEVVIPVGLNITGQVTFDLHGVPTKPGEFSISKGQKSQKVSVDAQGMITEP